MSDDLPALLPVFADPELTTGIAALALRYRRAKGPVVSVITRLGGKLETQMALLPVGVRDRVGSAVEAGLRASWAAASAARLGPKVGPRGSMAAAVAAGAAGGAGGLATSMAELPVTVTLILHAIRAEAEAAGYDPDDPHIAAECLAVFAAGSPLAADDGIDTAFLSARLTLTGPALQGMIAAVAPKLAAALTQKLAAQAVPVLGAVSGAALNAAFLSYYREMARIRFALMRLAETQGGEAVVAAFARAIEPPKISKV